MIGNEAWVDNNPTCYDGLIDNPSISCSVRSENKLFLSQTGRRCCALVRPDRSVDNAALHTMIG